MGILAAHDHFGNLLKAYSKHGGKVLDHPSNWLRILFYFRFGSFDWIANSLYNSSNPWTIDECSSLEKCVIGTTACLNSRFRDWLRKNLASYRSPFPPNQAASRDSLFESVINSASIASNFRKLHNHQKSCFVSLLCRTGSISTLKLLIHIRIDVNSTRWFPTILGYAAAGGNLDVAFVLLAMYVEHENE